MGRFAYCLAPFHVAVIHRREWRYAEIVELRIKSFYLSRILICVNLRNLRLKIFWRLLPLFDGLDYLFAQAFVEGGVGAEFFHFYGFEVAQ